MSMPLRNGGSHPSPVWWGTFETGDLYATSHREEASRQCGPSPVRYRVPNLQLASHNPDRWDVRQGPERLRQSSRMGHSPGKCTELDHLADETWHDTGRRRKNEPDGE